MSVNEYVVPVLQRMRQPLDGIDSKMYAWMRGEDLTRAFVMLAAFPRSPWQRDGHRLEHVISYQLDSAR